MKTLLLLPPLQWTTQRTQMFAEHYELQHIQSVPFKSTSLVSWLGVFQNTFLFSSKIVDECCFIGRSLILLEPNKQFLDVDSLLSLNLFGQVHQQWVSAKLQYFTFVKTFCKGSIKKKEKNVRESVRWLVVSWLRQGDEFGHRLWPFRWKCFCHLHPGNCK